MDLQVRCRHQCYSLIEMVFWDLGSVLEAMDAKFNASSSQLEVTPIWVRVPGLPLSFWTKEIFQEIGSTLGNHYNEVYLSYKQSRPMAMAPILFGLKLLRGLTVCISIKHKGHIFTQELDYEGIPFICGPCLWSLEKDCTLMVKKWKWVKKMIPEKQGDSPPTLPVVATPVGISTPSACIQEKQYWF
jgi:hypothetical protein